MDREPLNPIKILRGTVAGVAAALILERLDDVRDKLSELL